MKTKRVVVKFMWTINLVHGCMRINHHALRYEVVLGVPVVVRWVGAEAHEVVLAVTCLVIICMRMIVWSFLN
jgi:hypothetical protein